MVVPDYQTLMLPVLEFAASAAGDVRVMDSEEAVAGRLRLATEDRVELLPSGRQRVLYNRVQWAKTYMARAGLLEMTGRGRFRITERGRGILAKKPAAIGNDDLMEFQEFRDFRERGKSRNGDGDPPLVPPVSGQTPEEMIDSAFETISSSLEAEILERVRASDPEFFEKVIIELLLAMGYGGSHEEAGKHLGRSHDGGVDGVINEDKLGLERVYIQAKRYAAGNTVGSGEIRNFSGSLIGFAANKGVFVTTSSFARTAVDFTEKVSQRIILIDGTRLARLLVAHNVGVRTTRTVEIKRLDEDFFAE